MKYVLAGLAIVAAIAALFFRPPHGDTGAPLAPAAISAPPAFVDGAEPARKRGSRPPLPLPPRIIVYVAGEVARPGVYALPPGSRAEAALARAGGAKADADLVGVNLAALLDDGVEVAVPKIGEPARSRGRTAAPHRRAGRAPRSHGHHRRSAAPAPAAMSIDLNTAAAAELEAVPGIGPALAARIVEYRAVNGPFGSVDELADISGITPRVQEELETYVTVR